MSGSQGDDVVFDINGRQIRLRVDAAEPLLRTLRETLGFTSTRGACGIGVCGTCTVLVDGRAASSCILLTRQVHGRSVTTAEGLVCDDGRLSDVQETFVDCGAYQCSFCIPAMTLTVHACLRERPDATVEDVRHELGGNLCRCGTYPQILDAVRELLARRGSNGAGGGAGPATEVAL